MKKLLFLILFLPVLSRAQVVNISSMDAPGTLVPSITTSVSVLSTAFSTNTGTASSSQSFTTSASSLTGGGTVTAGSGYEVSLDNSTFAGTRSISITSGAFNSQPVTVFVRLAAADAAGTYNSLISISSTGATTRTVSVSGTVNTTSPTLTVTGSFAAFNTTAGTASTAQTVTVSGVNLTASCVVTPPSPLVSSLDGTTYNTSSTITQSGGNLSGQPVTVFVRVPASASAGTVSGNVAFASTGATTQNLATSGTISTLGTNDTTDVNIWDSVNNVGKVTSPATWNNWGLTEVTNIISMHFKNHAGTLLPMQMQFDAINADIDNTAGYNSGTTSGFPVLAFREAIFNNTSSNSLTITGLGAPTHGVRLEIGCSHINTGTATRHVTFTVGAVTQTVNAIGNDVTVVLDNLTPSSGTIVVAITDDTGFWYVDFVRVIIKN